MKYDGPKDVLKQDHALPSQNQYTYIGSVLETEKGSKTKFIFHCNECAKDPELFGDSLFWTRKSDFQRGQLFCGCGKKAIWTLEQATVKSIRAATEAGHVFHSIISPYSGGQSRCNLSCPKCNHTWTSKLSNLWSLKRGCPSCRSIKGLSAAIEAWRKPDDVIIKSFMETGSYHPDTIFVKIERKAKNSRNNYWSIFCPVCEKTAECQQGHLQKGNTPCGCSLMHQKETYINFVKDDNEVIAIKFGISKDSRKRLVTHNYNTPYEIEMFGIFKYEESFDCKAAERACKEELVCGVIEKEMFVGGWTETTYPYNLDRVISIFESYGGIRVF